MESLQEYLARLNCSETQWGLWVNPENINEFREGQFIFENGGKLDGFICIGTLDELSCGFQPEGEILQELLRHGEICYRKKIFSRYNCNFDGFIEAYFEKRLAPGLQKLTDEMVTEVRREWAEDESQKKIEEI